MLIDTHAHLDVSEFAGDWGDVVRRAAAAGVGRIVCPGITAESSRRATVLAAENSAIYAAVGIQPNSCGEAVEGDWEMVERMAEAQRVVAIGETGLDRYWDFTPLDVQRDYFERHLELASRRDLPVLIHCREAEADLLPTLRDFLQRNSLRGVIHAFSGDVNFARKCVDLGLLLSFAGAVTYTNAKFENLWEAARYVPDDRLLVETDSPYLTPHPLRGKQKRNEPSLLIHTVERLASLRGQTASQIADLTTANARELFRLTDD